MTPERLAELWRKIKLNAEYGYLRHSEPVYLTFCGDHSRFVTETAQKKMQELLAGLDAISINTDTDGILCKSKS